ncbi:N-acetyl-gamma-glutamyl-phosphate reductase [Peribacillus sp. B-H-3]|uniref:N-acetyl-gamma-glutamyl-phosphate reductase n=1 Tax=Peribacillus sp. B-H-3 TaxID=3400420 RepID=UPI003B018A3C
MRASIVGASGYSGLELIRILDNHPGIEIVSVHGSSSGIRGMTDEYAHLMHKNMNILEFDPGEIASASELVFVAAPSGISGELVSALHNYDVRIIDLSGDLRLKTPGEYERWYKHKSAPQELVNEAVYGLSEWNAASIGNARIIANPGCYATAALLGLAPLITENLVAGDIVIDAMSGVSGAGKAHTAMSHFSEMNENLKIYKVNQHQHIPEIEQQLSSWSYGNKPITFNTHLIPMTRGIMATMHIALKQETSASHLAELYKSTYEKNPFVRIQNLGTFPCTKQVYGSNFCDIGVSYDKRTNKATIVSVIDNLVKGAAGQAIQNANIMMGLKEETGLLNIPVYP